MTNQELQDKLEKAQIQITELEQKLVSRKKSENTYRSIIDISPVPYALNDEHQNIIHVNTAFINTFGYDLSDIPTLNDWWPKAYPDQEYRQWVHGTWQQHLNKSELESKPFEPFEVKVCCKDGTVKSVMAGAASLSGISEGIHLVTLFDMTETKQTEAQLNQTITLLENVINSTPDLIVVKNKKLQTILCNEVCAKAVGKSREDMYGHTDIENGWDPELVKGNPDKGIRGFMHDDLDALSGLYVHNPHDRANVAGKVRVFDTHKIPLKDTKGEILGVLGIARDVTERHEAEIKLQESETRFRSIVEDIENIAIQGYDKDHRVIVWNRASEKLYGYSQNEALGQSLEDLIIPDEMREIVTSSVNQWIEKDIPIPASELILRNKAGELVSVYSSHTMQKMADGSVELYCLDINTSELKQTQKELHRVNTELGATLRAIPDLLFEVDEEGRYLNIWARDEELLAVQKKELIGSTINEKLPEEAARISMQALKQAAEIGHSQGHVISLPLASGNHWFELSIALKSVEDGLKHFIVISRDITERIHTEEQLRRSQKMDALGKLTGGIAHDFNNMLGVILGYAELLQGKVTNDPQLSRYVGEIRVAGNRSKSLTSKLLAFSRKQPSELKSHNINNILNSNQHMLEKTLTAKIKLILDQDEDLWSVCIDDEMLSDAILNMSINSMHAMPEGGRLVISTENKAITEEESQQLSISAGDYIKLSFTDTGTGLLPEIKEKIFEPFFTTKGDAGTGLGMSQVYGFVKQSKGDIQVFSEPGKGTQIAIYLPRYIKDGNDDSDVIKQDKIPAPSKNETILVVDDEPALRDLAEEILNLQNYQVLSAESGSEALKILNKNDIDLMITDVIMPGMDGYQLASEVKFHYPNIKIIMASGYSDEASREGVDTPEYQQLQKPYRSADLLKNIRDLLDE